jgi:GMP reductase
MRIDNDPKLDFDDVPIVASNMDTVGTLAMAEALGPEMLTCLHKYYSEDQLIRFFGDEAHCSGAFFTLGLKDDEFEKLRAVKAKADVRLVCVDAANGYTKYFVEHVKRIRETFPGLTIMAGNVATPDMVQELLISGAADIVKIGIGPGSVCTTRRTTGVGYPQLSAIIECADAAHGLRGHVCADGGCRYPGDVVKAFAAGADFVMLGGMLAGHDECEGDWIEEDGRRVALKFYGMSSLEALDKYAGGRRDYRACEGRAVSVPYKGPVKETVQEITGGIRSACAYVGATRLKDLSKCTTFVICHRPHGSMFA